MNHCQKNKLLLFELELSIKQGSENNKSGCIIVIVRGINVYYILTKIKIIEYNTISFRKIL